jgi:hypothetical protein
MIINVVLAQALLKIMREIIWKSKRGVVLYCTSCSTAKTNF